MAVGDKTNMTQSSQIKEELLENVGIERDHPDSGEYSQKEELIKSVVAS